MPSDRPHPSWSDVAPPSSSGNGGIRRCGNLQCHRSMERGLASPEGGVEQDRSTSPSPPLRRACVRARRDDFRVGPCAERAAVRRCRRNQHDLRLDAHGSPPGDDSCRRRPSRLRPRPSWGKRFDHSAERLEPDPARQQHARLLLPDAGSLLQGRRCLGTCELQLVMVFVGHRCGSGSRFQGDRADDSGRFAQRRVHAQELVRRRPIGNDDSEERHRRGLLRDGFGQSPEIALGHDPGVRRPIRGSRGQGRGVHPGECRGNR